MPRVKNEKKDIGPSSEDLAASMGITAPQFGAERVVGFGAIQFQQELARGQAETLDMPLIGSAEHTAGMAMRSRDVNTGIAEDAEYAGGPGKSIAERMRDGVARNSGQKKKDIFG